MSKEKLRTPLFAVLRSKALFPTSNFSQIFESALSTPSPPNYISRSQLSSRLECSRSQLDNLRFSTRIFCSRAAEEADLKLKCWNCNAVPPMNAVFLVCESCRSIQPVDREKEYEFGDVNLESKYKDWQKKLHPDLVHSKSDNEREYAAEQSARVIDAYRTLRSPLSRAKYILKLEGVDVNEEDTISEPELLNEIMEIREAVEDASGSPALNQIQSQMREKLNDWSNKFGKALESRNFDEAISSIQRMTYYERVSEEITKKL